MSETQELEDPGLSKLEQQHAAKAAATGDEEFLTVEDSSLEALRNAKDLLQRTVILLEYISEPTFCKAITKRERDAINKHLEHIYVCNDELGVAIGELEEEDE